MTSEPVPADTGSPLTEDTGVLTRTQWVDNRLRSAIVSGELPAGSRLRPADLAARWNVSPTPIREALLRLEAAGLVETVPHRGTSVTPLTRQRLHQLYELRVLLEPLALRKSLARREYVDVARLQASYDALAHVHSSEDVMLIERTHREFHSGLLAGCDSKWLLSLVTSMSDHSSRYRLLSAGVRGGPEGINEQHAQLLETFLAGDTERAVALLAEHIGQTLAIESLLPEESP